MKVTVAVLDYNQPEETEMALRSLKTYGNFDKHVLFLDNGSDEQYSIDFLNEGLIDELIINRYNNGCGEGMEQLFQCARTKYVLLHQSDNYIQYNLDQPSMDHFISMLESGEYHCIDLNGNQGKDLWSDRPCLVSRELYLSVDKVVNGHIGGPGPYNHIKYSEQFMGEHFTENNLKIAHIQPVLFRDTGKWSIRETLYGGKFKHRADTQQLWVLERPTQRTEIYPDLTDEEWDLVLTGKWIDGTIPERAKKHSFDAGRYWPDFLRK